MSEEDCKLKILRYEKSLEIYYHEMDLLFQRFNFFMAGMSFLIVAFATIVASDYSHSLRIAIMGLGIIISLIFALINWLAARTIRRFDKDSLSIVEKEVFTNKPKEQLNSNPAKDKSEATCPMKETCPIIINLIKCKHFQGDGKTASNGGPFNEIRRYATDNRCIKWFDERFPILHTWFIPILFACFWIAMLVKFWR
jgi:hypothetical protein